MVRKIFKDPIYYFPVFVAIDDEPIKTARWYAKNVGTTPDWVLPPAGASCCLICSDIRAVCIHIDRTNADSGTIAHEAFHAVVEIMNQLETPLVRIHSSKFLPSGSSTEEPYAYLLGWIVRNITGLMRKEYEKAKKKR
jgi:hypothetical protein